MVTQTDLAELAAWHADRTNVRALMQALTNVWQDANRNDTSDPTQLDRSLIRSRVANLVIFAADRGTGERAASAIARVAGTHPSRSILIVPDPNATEASLAASLAVYGTPTGESHRFSFEHIEVTVRGGAMRYVSSIVTQLSVPELPTLLWWPGDPPFGQSTFRSLTATAERVIFDSSDFSDPLLELTNLANLGIAGRGRIEISDFNWHRLVDWREMVAQFFDSGTTLPYLEHIREVEVDHAFDPAGEHSSAQALLMAGWLMSRLDWQVERAERRDDGAYTVRLQQDGRSVAIHIKSVKGLHLRAGSVCQLKLWSAVADQRAVFSVSTEPDGEHVTTVIVKARSVPISRTVRLDQRSESALLSEEIETFGHERAFDDALQGASSIARSLQEIR